MANTWAEQSRVRTAVSLQTVVLERQGTAFAAPVRIADGSQRRAVGGILSIMGRLSTLNVSLTQHQREFVDALVTSGGYESPSEVIRESLRLLEEQERIRAACWENVWAKVTEAREAMAGGEYADGETLVARLDADLARKTRRHSRHRR